MLAPWPALALFLLPIADTLNLNILLRTPLSRVHCNNDYEIESFERCPTSIGSLHSKAGCLSRRQLIFAAVSTSVGLKGGDVEAFCGDTFSPEWVYSLEFNEGVIPFVNSDGSKAKIFVRVVGNEVKEAKSKVRPLLIIPGGPGLAHDYTETLEAVAKTNRRVLSFDPVGTGLSSSNGMASPPNDLRPLKNLPSQRATSWASPESLSRQAMAVTDAAGFAGAPHHVWAHGTGAAAALLYAAGRDDVASLTLASPVFGSPPAVGGGSPGDDTEDAAGLKGGDARTPSPHPWTRVADSTVREFILSASSTPSPIRSGGDKDTKSVGSGASSSDKAGVEVPSGFSAGSGPPLGPVCLAQAVETGSAALYAEWQPSEADALRAAAARVGSPRGNGGGLPTLLTSGGHDLVETRASLDLARSILSDIATKKDGGTSLSEQKGPAPKKSPFLSGSPRVEEVVYSSSGHMAHLQQREQYLSDLFDFLGACDEAL